VEDSSASMRVTICRSTERTAATVARTLDGDKRRLVISTPWRQQPSETWQQIRPMLTDDEARAVAAAFDLDDPQ
jgi:hypothetical protein